MYDRLVPGCSNARTHQAPGGAETQALCGKHFEQFVAYLIDPAHNPNEASPQTDEHVSGEQTRTKLDSFASTSALQDV